MIHFNLAEAISIPLFTLVVATAGCGCRSSSLDADRSECHSYRDLDLIQSFPDVMHRIAMGQLPDARGLTGRNREWGDLVSPRFQMGSGLAARVFTIENRRVEASEALRAIETGLSVIDETGRLVSKPPPGASSQMLPPGEMAQGASFFLGDACLGLLALERTPADWGLYERLNNARAVVARATIWLLTQEPLLDEVNAQAPNRLLFDMRAYSACGELLQEPRARAAALCSAKRAVALTRTDGVFIEGGGYDTSYQGVCLMNGYDTLTCAEPELCRLLDLSLLRGARWLADRVDVEGRVKSSGNARTCEGGEVFLGAPKLMSISSVFLGLAAIGVTHSDSQVVDASRRVANWWQEHPYDDPCYQ
jgi:hypothetical protein